MATTKSKIDWFKISLGFFFVFAYFWADNKKIDEYELKTKQIVVSSPIQRIKGNRSNLAFRFETFNYPCSFVIKTAGEMASKWKNLEHITANDTLAIKIHYNTIKELTNESAEIPVYALQKNGIEFYDVESYNDSQKVYNKRWRIIWIIIGVLLSARGLLIISSRTGYILGGLSLITIIILKMLNLY